jgi:hypothetical protein
VARNEEPERGIEGLTDIALLYPSRYLCCADLRGRDVTLTIHRVALRDLKTTQGRERRVVIHFAEMQKRDEAERKMLVCNKTNLGLIATALGQRDPNKWGGRKITLYGTRCEAFGKTVDCIRVRDTAPAAKGKAAPKPAETLPIDAPFTDEEVGGREPGDEPTPSDYDPISDMNP